LSSRSEFQQSLRKLKPEKRREKLARRDRSELRYLSSLEQPFPKLLLDTAVYVDTLQGSLPAYAKVVLRAASLWHSTVAESELAVLAGLLDPAHVETTHVISQIAESVDRWPAHRILTPDRETWREAGILAGILARLQHYGKSERRKALNDALIFLTGAKNGCTVLTRNLADFDLLLQLDDRGQVAFYEAI
jgi:predicted nucleic acid-binding protein